MMRHHHTMRPRSADEASCGPTKNLDERTPAVIDGVQILPAGESIYRDGDPAAAVYALLTGRLRLTSRTNRGAAVVTGRLQPGSLFGLDSLSEPTYGETATAETPCSVRAVPVPTLDRLLAHRPELAAGLLEALVRRRAAAERLLTRALVTGVPGRLAGALIEAADGLVVDGLTRQQLAEAAWTTRETATRVLFQFAASGLLRIDGRRIELVDIDRLHRLASGARRRPAA